MEPTIKDIFAALAMVALINKEHIDCKYTLARQAYSIAEAMLEEKAKNDHR